MFILIIGKPGSGKTTVGNLLSNGDNIGHFSYGQLLRDIQPNPPLEGYSTEDREKVDQLLIQASDAFTTIIVDGNPYSKIGFGFLDRIEKFFNRVLVFHLLINDRQALARLEGRNREVSAHDGTSQKERIDNFDQKILPLIQKYKEGHTINEIDVSEMTTEQVARSIMSLSGDFTAR